MTNNTDNTYDGNEKAADANKNKRVTANGDSGNATGDTDTGKDVPDLLGAATPHEAERNTADTGIPHRRFTLHKDDASADLQGDALTDDAVEDGKAGVPAKEEKRKRTVKQEILSWVGLLLAAVAIATVVRALLIEPIKVDGRSMLETLQHGEIVLVTKPKMLLGRLERGDVVICRFPTREQEYTLPIGASLDISLTNHTLFVKRLVALPGDTVAVSGGVLYVNDQPVDEPYVTYPSRADYPTRLLGPDEYMVMGDNRANSHDSRSSDVGPLKKNMIVGRAAFVLFPFDKFGAVK